MLATQHNLFHYQALMRDIRAAIDAGRFEEFRAEFYRLRQTPAPE
jgi:queuine tRNA-ribosyltransferase